MVSAMSDCGEVEVRDLDLPPRKPNIVPDRLILVGLSETCLD